MAADHSTHQSGYDSALRAAQRQLNIGLHHAGILKGLSEGRLPMDLVEEGDTLEIESSALLDALQALHDMLNGKDFESRSSIHESIPHADSVPARDPHGLPSDVVKLIRDALLIGLKAYGECEKLIDAADGRKACGESVPEDLCPQHPTGCHDLGTFSDALQFLDIYDSGRLA